MSLLSIDEFDVRGSLVAHQTVPIANPTVQVLDATGTPVAVPVYSTAGGTLAANYSVSAPLQEATLGGGTVVFSGGPAVINFGNDPRPSRNGIAIPPEGLSMPPLGRRIAVL